MSLSHQEILGSLDDMCEAASKCTLALFRKPFSVENKLQDDFDPVTAADKAAEQAIRAIITERYPDHGIIGEEYGTENPDAPYQWIIDPIDGTRAFISGIPVWGTLIGLYHHNRPRAGIMSQPFTGERYWSVPDGDHLKSAMRIHQGPKMDLQTRNHDVLGACTLMTTSPAIFPKPDRLQYDRLENCVQLARYGCDCYAYCLLAAGHVDLVVESGLSIYDIAALIPIVEGAGGSVADWQGGDASQGGHILAAANETIRHQAIDVLNA